MSTAKPNILLIDDEEDILELLKYNLTREGYRVNCATSGERGLELLREQKPDLLILDLMLPGIDGLEICRILKGDSNTKDIRIVMLSAKGEEADVVTGLELGADDYIVKPFSPRVVSARVKSVLRRNAKAPLEDISSLKINGLSISTTRHEVKLDGDLLDLTNTEFKILHFLAKQPGWVFTRYQIVDAVHGADYPVTDRSIDVQIVGLRKKLGNYGNYIETIRGVGYRFMD